MTKMEETATAAVDLAKEFDQCIKCGLCLASCPVCKELLLEKYSPRGKVQLARFHEQGRLELSDHYRDIYSRCLLCGSCGVTCPSGVDLSRVFLEMRGKVAGARGLHPRIEPVAESLAENRNIADEDNAERGEWRELISDLPEHLYEKKQAEVAYFVGCVASFFPMVQAIPKNLVRIFERSGVDFAVLAGQEWCCGFPLLGAGTPDRIEELRAHNLDRVRQLNARQVVFSCPSCLRTWKELYQTDLTLTHASRFLEDLITGGRVPLGELNLTVTYHDPCDLGRHGGEYDAPRRVLKSIPGIKLKEMENNRARSTCCGGGGNLEIVDPGLSAAVAQRRLEEIQRTGAEAVVTACQQCVRTLKSRVRRQKLDLQVMDLTELVAAALDRA